jgi:hypothetical protein
MLLDQLKPDYALAQQVAADDPAIETMTVSYESPEGNGTIKGLMARPAGVTGGGCRVYAPALVIYRPLGTFTSSTFNSGAAGTIYIQAFWDAELPASTSITLEVRASDRLRGGAPNAAWRSMGGDSDGSMVGITGRYVQWRVTLTTGDISATPMLQEVRIYYRLG